MKAFLLELKSTCRNFRFLALIILLLCLLVMIYAQFKLEQVTEYESTLRSLNREVQGRKEWVEYWERRQRYYYTHGEPLDNYDIYTVESSLESSIGTYEEALNRRNAYKDKNWREYNLAMSEKTFSPYYSYLAEKNLPPIGPWDTTPWGFLFNSLRKLLPKVLSLIVLLISVNRLHQDRKFGTIKTNLSQPKMRLTYLAKKTALSFVASCLIVFIPLMLMFGILGVGQGYVGACLPVLYAKDNIWRLSYSDEEIFEIQDYPMTIHVGLSQQTLTWLGGYTPQMEYIAMWEFLLLVAAVILLFILFCNVLALLISVIIKNEVLAQILAIVLFLFGTALNRIFPKLRTLPLDLFAKADAIAILEGSHATTYTGAIISLVTAIVLFFALSAFIFRKQDEH